MLALGIIIGRYLASRILEYGKRKYVCFLSVDLTIFEFFRRSLPRFITVKYSDLLINM